MPTVPTAWTAPGPEKTVLTASRGCRAELGRPGEVEADDDIGGQLSHPVADHRFAAGEGGSGELGEAARGRPEEGRVAAGGAHAEDDAIVEGMVVADVAVAAEPALDAFAAPGRDAGAGIEAGPGIRRGRERGFRQRRIGRRPVGQVGGGSRATRAKRGGKQSKGGRLRAWPSGFYFELADAPYAGQTAAYSWRCDFQCLAKRRHPCADIIASRALDKGSRQRL